MGIIQYQLSAVEGILHIFVLFDLILPAIAEKQLSVLSRTYYVTIISRGVSAVKKKGSHILIGNGVANCCRL